MAPRTLAPLFALALVTLSACAPRGGSGPAPSVPPPAEALPAEGAPDAREAARAAIDAFKGHDERNDWTAEACSTLSRELEAASDRQAKKPGGGPLVEALYDAALARLRCGDEGEAKRLFSRVLEASPRDARTRTQLVSLELKASGAKGLDGAIEKLQQIVLDAEFQSAEALVLLASLEMRRGGEAKGPGCEGDLDCAKKNIQRALAVDDAFMPAYNQLGLYYLERARQQASTRGRASGRREKGADQQQLELAALVCSQAIRKNPAYAPVHNTAALVRLELGDSTGAAAELKTAIALDPRFVEALMNYAAVNLSFRGYREAERAYRAALELRPDDYDALLGLALALRGQITEASFDEGVRAAQEVLDRAKKVDDQRPEAYFNEAVLTQEFKVKAAEGKEAQVAQLRRASALLEAFSARAGSRPEMADALRKASERRKDIDDMVGFLQ